VWRAAARDFDMNMAQPPGSRISGQRITAFRRKLLAWFPTNGRAFPWREVGASPYLLLVVEVLLQRTRAETIRVFLPGFLERFPSWASIATCDAGELGEALKPIGLWRRRAQRLQGLAKEMVARKELWPRDREALESIPAVGQYVANAALLFIHDEPHPLMDASMARLLRRYFTITPERADIRYDKVLHGVAYRVLTAGNAAHLNWAMLDVAALYCKPKQPTCETCPLRRSCAHTRFS
jgi:A/G-specific adenine glycosylase